MSIAVVLIVTDLFIVSHMCPIPVYDQYRWSSIRRSWMCDLRCGCRSYDGDSIDDLEYLALHNS